MATPADADLVFEIRFTAPIASNDKVITCNPQLGLTILDAKMHFTVWRLTEPVEGAFRKATWNKNFAQGVTNLTADVRKLVGQP